MSMVSICGQYGNDERVGMAHAAEQRVDVRVQDAVAEHADDDT
jgi:hypothetical protein